MCTLVLLRRPAAEWPLLLAANRDELRSRPSLPPAATGRIDRMSGPAWTSRRAAPGWG